MSSLNRVSRETTAKNHYGLRVKPSNPQDTLVRMTMAHMLWEKQFYMDGESSVDILDRVVGQVDPAFVATVAKQARSEFKLRHVPLAIMRGLAKRGTLKAADLAEVIQRPDETAEFLKLYWKDGKSPISNQVKKGLGQALGKFNEYQLAKWDKNSAEISLRDVMFLTHPKPKDAKQADLFKRLANEELETPDTWETELSAGKNKGETFIRLMAERKLGALAFLRNLRNMLQSNVPSEAIINYAETVNLERVLPFRFLAAARQVPEYKDMLEQMMFKSLEGHEKLKGTTVLLVDCSGSMFGAKVSAKSDLDRFDAAASLAMLCREICEDVRIFGFSTSTVEVDPKARGFSLVEKIRESTSGGTNIGQAVSYANRVVAKFDRCICFTDEQSMTPPGVPNSSKNYMLNVASYEHGLNHGDWMTITGFSEAVLDYIQAVERTSA